MADKKVTVILSAKDQASKVFGKLGGVLKTSVVAGAAAAAAAMAALAFELVKATQAANVQEEAEVKLAVALRSIGKASRDALDGLKAHASGLQQVTRFGDETILGVQALLIQLGRLSDTSQIERTTEAILDFSAATGVELKAAALLFAKAAQGQTASLSRYGLTLREGIPEQEKFNALLNLAEQNFKGTAEALGRTFQDKFKGATNAFGDMQEQIGFTITQSEGMQEILATVTRGFEELSGFVEDNRDELVAFVKEGILVAVEGIELLFRGAQRIGETAGIIKQTIEKTTGDIGGFIGTALEFYGLGGETALAFAEASEESAERTAESQEKLSSFFDTLIQKSQNLGERIAATSDDARDATDALLGLGEAAMATAEANAELLASLEALSIGEQFEEFSIGVETLKAAEEQVAATNEKFRELGAAIMMATDPEVLGVLGESLVESIRQIDPEITSEAIVEKLRETFPEIDFEALAEEAPFFAELLKSANPESVGAAIGSALETSQSSIRQFTGGITELQNALSVLGVKGAGPFGKFAKATAKVQAVISTAQAVFELAQAIAAIASFRFAEAAQHGLAAAKFQLSAQAGKSAQGAIAAQEGGFVPMLPGANANQDSVMAMLQPGELVIPRPFAEEVRRAQGFQEGGVVGGEPGEAPTGGGVVNVAILPSDPSVLGPLLDAMSEAVERFGFRMVASEVAA